jgi:hypothetical protein
MMNILLNFYSTKSTILSQASTFPCTTEVNIYVLTYVSIIFTNPQEMAYCITDLKKITTQKCVTVYSDLCATQN